MGWKEERVEEGVEDGVWDAFGVGEERRRRRGTAEGAGIIRQEITVERKRRAKGGGGCLLSRDELAHRPLGVEQADAVAPSQRVAVHLSVPHGSRIKGGAD